MTWQPNKLGELVTTVDFNMNSFILKTSSQGKDKWWKNAQHKLEQSSDATFFKFLQTAPLVFPMLDKLVIADRKDSNERKKKQSAIRSGGAFVESYLDKRTTAKWAGQNPDSEMANTAPKEKFCSRYADPNHITTSGDPIALLTAGHLQSFGGVPGIIPHSDMASARASRDQVQEVSIHCGLEIEVDPSNSIETMVTARLPELG
jgi:hypothetical protein